MTERRNGNGRRTGDNVIALASNPCQKETIEALQQLYIQVFNTNPSGFGYFIIGSGLKYHWDYYGVARRHPELAIGILSKMNAELTHGK